MRWPRRNRPRRSVRYRSTAGRHLRLRRRPKPVEVSPGIGSIRLSSWTKTQGGWVQFPSRHLPWRQNPKGDGFNRTTS